MVIVKMSYGKWIFEKKNGVGHAKFAHVGRPPFYVRRLVYVRSQRCHQ